MQKPPTTCKASRHPFNLGKIVSFFIFISLFTTYPYLLKHAWHFFTQNFTGQYQRQCFIVILANTLCFGTYHSVMYFIYKAKHPFFEQYRCSSKQWQWQNQPEKWNKMLIKTLCMVIFNMFITNAFLVMLEIPLGGIKYKYSLQEFPSGLTIFAQLIFAMLVEDFFFYWGHYALHRPSLYWIHKTHHQYKITISLATTYSHPIEYFWSSTFPTGIGLSILSNFVPVHFATMFIWITYRVMEACQGHCGYQWSWSTLSFLPFKLGSNQHYFHHMYNAGNYGSLFSFWDNLMKTNVQCAKFKAKDGTDQSKRV